MIGLTALLIHIGALRDEYFTKLHAKKNYNPDIDEDSYYKGRIDAYNEVYGILADIRNRELGE